MLPATSKARGRAYQHIVDLTCPWAIHGTKPLELETFIMLLKVLLQIENPPRESGHPGGKDNKLFRLKEYNAGGFCIHFWWKN